MNAVLEWLNPTRWVILCALVLGLVVGYFAWAKHQQSIGEARAVARYEKAIAAQKREAATLLSAETAKVRALEAQLGAARAEQEKKDADARKTVDDLRKDLRARSRAAGGDGLRDPGRGGGGGGAQGASPASPASGGANPADGAGVLSARFESMLLDWFEKADQLNIAYASCRADAIEVRRALK